MSWYAWSVVLFLAAVSLGGIISFLAQYRTRRTMAMIALVAAILATLVLCALTFLGSSFANYNPQSVVDVASCLQVVDEGQYYDITFSSYSGGGPGGGFAYTRQAYCGATATCSNTTGSYQCVQD